MLLTFSWRFFSFSDLIFEMMMQSITLIDKGRNLPYIF